MDSIVRALLKNNTNQMRVNDVNGKYYYLNKNSPLTVQNYKVLFRKLPKAKKLKSIGKKVGAPAVKSNIVKALRKRKIADPMQITIKVKRKSLNNSKPKEEREMINKLMKELRRLQKKI
jgi:hypothetical protein